MSIYPKISSFDSANGLVIGTESLPFKWAPINATASGDNTIIAAVTGRKIRVIAISFNAALAVGISFKSNPGNTKIEQMLVAANGNFAANHFPGWFMETNVGEAFIMNNSLAINVRGSCAYVEIT